MDKLKGMDFAKFSSVKNDHTSSKCCVLEVDLEFPKELHELHSHYSLAPDKSEINIKTKYGNK